MYRSRKADGTYKSIAVIKDVKELSYIDEKKTCGVEYFYKIRAYKKNKKGATYGTVSKPVSARTTPSKISYSDNIINEKTKITLSWTQSNGADGYQIYRSIKSNSGFELIKTIKRSDRTKWTDEKLDKETVYYYKVRPYCNVKDTIVTGGFSEVYKKKVYNGDVSKLRKYVGAPYVPGGNGPDGWDCSGFTQWAIKHIFGIDIPDVSASQGVNGKKIDMNDRSKWEPGDILVYSKGKRICHVAIYMGNGEMMHALNSKYDTIIQDVDYYESWDKGTRLTGVRRYH